MRRFLAAILVLMVLASMVGCSHNGSQDETSAQNSDLTVETTAETTGNVGDSSVVYDENIPMFSCQDRADIEGDSYTVYQYNYKGDLLNSYESAQVGLYSKNGLAPAYDPLTGLIGFVDESGVFVIEPQWSDAASFSDDGFALVASKVTDGDSSAGKKYGYINGKGEQIIPCIYDFATSFYPCGLAIIGVYVEQKYTYTDENGAVQESGATVLRHGVIDTTGTVILEPQFSWIYHLIGEYIYCDEGIYDLSGKLICGCPVRDETHDYAYSIGQGQLYRYILTEDGHYTDPKVFDGTQFVDPPYDASSPIIEWKRVATTSSGMGYGVRLPSQENGDTSAVVIPYEYDLLVEYGSFYIGIRYLNGDQHNQTLDIYNEHFEKTAENLEYNFYLGRDDPFGLNVILPDGYFQVYAYDSPQEENLCGIIDSTGRIIVPLLYYRPIRLLTYAGAGGKFDISGS